MNSESGPAGETSSLPPHRVPPRTLGPVRTLGSVRAFYPTGQEIEIGALPGGCRQVVARRATGEVAVARPVGGMRFIGLGPGTYSIEALGPGGELLAEELTTVGAHPGERPVHGFATSFQDDKVDAVLDWLKALRCTVVQIYDWMERYSAPLGPAGGWKDPLGRHVSLEALRALVAGARANGAVAHAYSPVYAMEPAFASSRPDLLMYRGDGGAQRFFDLAELANPASRDWQRHFAATYGQAADAIGFNGFHLDTYGYPRAARDSRGHAIDMRAAYESFLAFFRDQRPSDLLSFNQVNGVPSALRLPPGPRFRYCEVWAPNDRWRHLEGLMDRSAGLAGLSEEGAGARLGRGTVACYPQVWPARPAGPEVEGAGRRPGSSGGVGREAALRTVLCTEAVATCLGASALLFGDLRGALCEGYYPKYERLSDGEAATVLAWHLFGLRCRDLFLDGEDTSWYDIGDEHDAVTVEWDGPVSPEPVGRSLFARVARTDRYVAVGLVDLSGSAEGSWSQPTLPGRCRSARARILLDDPERWEVAVATLGASGDRFTEVPRTEVGHTEGRAIEVVVPVVDGWSVVRLTR